MRWEQWSQPAPPPNWANPSIENSDVLAQIMRVVDPFDVSAVVYDYNRPTVFGASTGDDVHLARFQKIVAPAPHVGDPFVYLWWAGIDTITERIVATGPATIYYLSYDPMYDVWR